jgi:hypothetical protein
MMPDVKPNFPPNQPDPTPNQGMKYQSDQTASEEAVNSPRRISASILCPHPAGYPGRKVLHYGMHEWRLLFQELKDLGIDTVILEKTADLDTQEVYYSSRRFASCAHFNLLEPLLHAAAHEDLAVFLGGAINSGRFAPLEDLESLLEGFRELRAYRHDFHGFYIVAPDATPSTQAEASLHHQQLDELSSSLKRIAPEMTVLLAPAGPPSEEFLDVVYQDLPIEILVVKDGMGSGGTDPLYVTENLKRWNRVSTSLDAELWITVEPYEPSKALGPNQAVPTSFNRLQRQLETAGQYSEKTIGLDVPYFHTHKAGEAGARLRKDYMDQIALGFVDK